ncbi:manganese-dependent inorganic pyrophosphatase [Terribacillus aidingensis]|uniref:Probable manganese-dependent inorganic pyrophosphatase n=1 Tax=Terribacillus aidingensis TaxID=586416 RepID=A0A285P5Q2_9BACI|nr:manganese-dependent inorganic pyrophosphatase [Terribacillus aidingensis]SNZ17089.1 manganese-dependent inorganic pyrophosphatase [Terribacillus aidingensis]
MGKVLVFGHKNPDTDAVTSAIAYAHLKNKLGMEAEAVRLGELNEETAFALKTFGLEAPRMIEAINGEVEQVILVDHNEKQQSVSDIDTVSVMEVVDHHRIANFETADPLYYRAEPVGCTATILKKIYKEHDVEIPKEIAGAMLSAIVSDSLLFKSPTCTEEDVKAAKELAEIADVDVNTYGLDMLKAGADVSKKTAEELITLDAKEFQMGDATVEIAQVNVVDEQDVLVRQAEVEAAMKQKITEKGLKLYLFAITNILTNDSTAIAIGAETEAVEKAFHVTLSNNTATLKGVVSRKKQIVPVLTEVMNG